MNLSPDWVAFFLDGHIESIHWSSIGDPRAEDGEIMTYARENGYVVFTHDLDFGTALALTSASSPSVIQVRTQDILPSHLGNTIVRVINDNVGNLDRGALIVVDENRERIRILPLRRKG